MNNTNYNKITMNHKDSSENKNDKEIILSEKEILSIGIKLLDIITRYNYYDCKDVDEILDRIQCTLQDRMDKIEKF